MQTSNNLLLFSVFSGTFYEIPENDFPLMDVGQLPLNKKPSNNCSKCYGRGYTARDTQTQAHVPCKCLRKLINFDLIKNEKNNPVS